MKTLLALLLLISSLSWSGEPSSSTKAKIIMSIENNQMVSKAAFGNDVVGGDSAYEIFWVWMPEIK